MAEATVIDAAKTGGAASAEPQPDAHKRSLFIKDSDSGLKPKERGFRAGKKEGALLPKNAEFSAALKREYSDFLDNYITGLLKLKEVTDPATGKSLYDSVLNNPNHFADRQLVELLTSEKKNARGVGYDKGVDEAKVKRFLSTAEGKILTTQLLERNTALRLFAIGLSAAATPEARRDNLGQPGVYRTGVNEGAIRDFEVYLRENLPGTPGQRQAMARLSVGLGIAGRIAFGPGGYVLGGVPAAVYGAQRGIEYLRREGMVFRMEQSVGAFKAINGNPVEKAFVREVFGIDTDDFMVTPAGTIELKLGRIPESLNIKDQQFKVLQNLYRRREFYTALGVPQDRLDALPEQFLYRVSTTSPLEGEKTGAWWEDRVMKAFKPNEGGVRDAAGRRRRNPNFNAGLIGLDDKGNILRFLEARNSVLGEDMQRFLELELAKGDGVNTVEVLENKIKELGKPEGLAERKSAFTKKIEGLTSDKGLLDKDKATTDSYKTALEALQKARVDLDKEIAGISIVGAATATDLADALRILNTLNTPGGNVQVGARSIDSISRRTRDMLARRSTRLGSIAIPPGSALSAKEVREEVMAEFQSEADEIQADRDFVQKIRDSLTTLESDRKTKQEALSETNEMVKSVSKIDSFSKDFQTITALGINENDLRTLNFEQILAQINAAAGGWPVEQNSRADLRTRTLHAMLEAKARHTNPAFAPATPGSPTEAFELLNNPAGLNISENRLRTLSRGEIRSLVGAGPTDVQIDNAIRIANERFTGRAKVLSDRIDEMTEEIKREEARKEEVKADKELEFLKTTVKLLKKRAEMSDFPGNIATKPATFVDAGPVLATDRTYTGEEKAVAQPKGYYEMLDLFFGYKNSLTRAKDFEVYARVIPADRIARVLNETLEMFPGPAAAPLVDVLTEMGNRINNKQIDASHMQIFVGRLAFELAEEARTV